LPKGLEHPAPVRAKHKVAKTSASCGTREHSVSREFVMLHHQGKLLTSRPNHKPSSCSGTVKDHFCAPIET